MTSMGSMQELGGRLLRFDGGRVMVHMRSVTAPASGSHGVVHISVLWQEGQREKPVVVKCIPRSNGTIHAEKAMLMYKHPHLCTPLLHKMSDSFDMLVFERMEYSLKCLVHSRKSPKIHTWNFNAAAAFGQILRGLLALHALGWMHCDLKPDNIMYKEGIFKIIDFGLSRQIGSAPGPAFSGGYRPPEVALGMPFDTKADVWALAVVGVEMELRRPILPVYEDHQIIPAIERLFYVRIIDEDIILSNFEHMTKPLGAKRVLEPREEETEFLKATLALLVINPSARRDADPESFPTQECVMVS